MADEIKASPQSPALATLARMLRAARSAGDTVTVPYLGGVGTMMLGKSPEEVTEWSYGNAPLHVPQMTRVPQFKKDRAEQLADTLFAAQAAAPMARMAPVAARELAPAAGAMAMRAAEVGGMPVGGLGVIKNKGGNWLAGSVEGVTRDLKRYVPDESSMAAINDVVGFDAGPQRAGDIAINKWLETKLNKYIKNEMATPEDPLRALAEKGVSHLPIADLEQGTSWIPESVAVSRMRGGFPVHGMAESPAAKGWEASADAFINAAPASQHTRPLTPSEVRLGYESTVKDNPWLLKVPPETPVYYPEFGKIGDSDMGFPHLVDELRNAVNPESGLPANLRWKYGDLEKVTVPQAVQRVHDINTWRAEQKVIADQARANNAAAFLHKDYPDAPYKWVELKAKDVKSKEDLGDLGLQAYFDYTKSGGDVNYALKAGQRADAEKYLADALKYEGETMGHCVGGYCPDVLEGRSRIFSLRNKKTGEPHVTVEVQPNKFLDFNQWWDKQPKELRDEINARARRGEHGGSIFESPEYLAARDELPPVIKQIKGKANLAPKEEYLPYVQDFVKSGKWSDVGDIGNTGLIMGRQKFNPVEHEMMRSAGHEIPEYMSETELQNLMKIRSQLPDPEFAQGGLVDGAAEYNPLEVDYILNNIHGYATGGLVTQQVKAPFNEFSMNYDINPVEIGHAEGGSVESAHIPYDEAKISSLVNALREELHA